MLIDATIATMPSRTLKVGNVTSITDTVNGTVTRTYDALYRLQTETTTAGSTSTSITYTYDKADRLTLRQFTGVDSVQHNIRYDWFNNNWLMDIYNGGAQVTFAYNPDGTRQSTILPNQNLACYHYDGAPEITEIDYYQTGSCSSPGNFLGSLTYGYDAAGRIVTRGGVSPNASTALLFQSILPGKVNSATYNADNQLKTRTTPGSAVYLNYDLNGNLLCSGGQPSCTGTTYTWDSRNRLTGVSDGSAYTYDAIGRRQTTTLNGSTRTYFYDGGNVIEDRPTTGQTNANVLLTGPGLDERYGRANNGVWDYMLTDALGSTVGLDNTTTGATVANYGYDPYGVTTTTGAAIVNTNRFTGRELDSVSLYYYRGRYYTPATGRFISEDPLAFGGGDYNLYRYVGGDPEDWNDPLGLRPLTACEKQMLTPYIGQNTLNSADFHPGEPNFFQPDNALGFTRGNDIYTQPGAYVPNTPGGLALLGHELVHVFQYSNGMTALDYLWEAQKHGSGPANKYENPAYYMQNQIYNDLKKPIP